MKRVQVKSSNIVSIGYVRETKIMTVEFTNGALYTYENVRMRHFVDLIQANSVGKKFKKMCDVYKWVYNHIGANKN